MRIVGLLLFTLIAVLLASADAHGGAEPARGGEPVADAQARDLETHLLAPCCWRETLAVHQSQVASALREEIRHRVAAGESAANIEGELVARHGQRIRAQLPDKLGYIIALFAVGFGLFFLYMIAKASSAPEQEIVPSWLNSHKHQVYPDRQKYEAILDDDLDRDPA